MWEKFLELVFNVIQFFYDFCHDWGLAIVIVTIIFRALITPLIYKQSKSTYMTRKLQPKLMAIKERFPDDIARQNEETQKVYAEAKFNPLAGCLPIFLQMPIFIALFQVLRGMADRLGDTSEYCFFGIIPDLVQSPSAMVEQGAAAAAPYIILLIIFAGATFVPSLLMQKMQGGQQQKTSLIIMAVMSVFMLWVGWGSPAGVLLFWGASSLLAILQQQVSLSIIKKKDLAKEAEKTEVVASQPAVVTRKIKKKRQHKSR